MHRAYTKSAMNLPVSPPTSIQPIPQVSLRVLIADGDRALRGLIAGALRHDGHRVTEVKSGADLVRQARRAALAPNHAAPDLLLLDASHSGEGALEALFGVRTLGWNVPVVLVTTPAQADLGSEARRLGATVLEQPVSLDGIRQVVSFFANGG
jgi:CheY-like chemotaxis protein